MRLFVAFELPESVRDHLAELQRELRSAGQVDQATRWVRAENLHVTLKFLGEVASEKLEGICGALAEIPATGPVELLCRGLGFFPDERRPQVLWAGLEANERLPLLASQVDESLVAPGIPREKRPFHPHVTLARFGSLRLPASLRAAIASSNSRSFGSFRAREFHLMHSVTKPSGAEYTRIRSFPYAEAWTPNGGAE